MEKHASTNWFLVAALFIAGLFAAAQFAKLSLTIPMMQEAYPNARNWVPTIVSINGIVGLVFGVVAGAHVVRRGISRMLILALAVASAVSLFQSLLPPIGFFALSRVIEGVSHLVIVVAAPTIMAQISSDKDRPFVMGIWASFFGCSYALIGVFLDDVLAAGGLSLLFQLHGAGFAICALAFLKILPKDKPQTVETIGFLRAYATIYSTPRILLPGAGFVWYTFIYIALIAVLPISLGIPVATVAAFPLVSIFGTVLAGYLAKFFGPDAISIVGFTLTAVLIIIVVAVSPAFWIIALLFLFMGFVPAGSFAAIPHFNSNVFDRAQATGGIAHFGNIGTTLGTPIMVVVAGSFGMTGVAVLTALCCLGGIAVLLRLGRAVKN